MKRHFVILFLCLHAFLQASASAITDKLSGLGFEDIRVIVSDSIIYASVEPASYRGTFRGAAVALLELGNSFPANQRVELVITEYRQPQVAIHAVRDSATWKVKVDYKTSGIEKKLKGEKTENSSLGRIDLKAYPAVMLDNHRFDILYEFALSIAPSLETTLWRGNRIILQPVFPIATNVWKERPEGYIHVGVATMLQDFRLCDGLHASVAGGMFMDSLMGFDVSLSWRAFKFLTFNLKGSQLADAYVADGKYHFGQLNKTSVLGKAAFHESLTQLEVELTGGRFAYGDYGARLDITRHCGEYAIGIFGILTGGEHNAGFHFAIPFGAKRQKRRGFFRVMLPEYFDMEYNMESYYKYAEEKMGRQAETRPDVNHSAHYWQASYVEQFLSKYLKLNN